MANGQDNNDEKLDSFEFDDSGEAANYISLDQARILAMQVASNEPGKYGQSFEGIDMAFESVAKEETDDYYAVTLSFRPQGDFKGTPGHEQFFIEKVGEVAYRQVLALPRIRQRQRVRLLSIVAVIGTLALGAILAALFAGGLLGSGSEGTNVTIANPSATQSPVGLTGRPPETPIPAVVVTNFIPTAAPEPTPAPTAASKLATATTITPPTPTPTLVPTAIIIPVLDPMPSVTPTQLPTPSPTAIPHPYGQALLGVQLRYVTPNIVAKYGLRVERGAMVTEVIPATAAATLKLKVPDVITRLNNRPVDSSDLWDRIFAEFEPGETVHVAYVRGFTEFEENVTLGAYYTASVSKNPGIRLNYFLERGQTIDFHYLEPSQFTLSILDPDGISLSFAVSAGRLTAFTRGTYQFIIKYRGRLMGLRTREVDWYYRISGTR